MNYNPREGKRQAKINDEAHRMERAAKALDYYNYEQDSYLADAIKARYKAEHEDILRYRFTAPVTESLINQLAVTFKEEPTITIDGSDAQKEAFGKLLDASDAMRKLAMADRYAELMHKVGLIPIWTGRRVSLQLLTPDKTIVKTDKYGDVEELRYWIGEAKENIHQVEAFRVWAVWTEFEYYEVETNANGEDIKVIPGSQEVNPYGRIPVAWFSTDEVLGSFWADKGYPIIELNENINMKVTNLDIGMDYQSFSTMVTIGMKDEESLPVGVTRRINIPRAGGGGMADGDVKYITPDAKLEAVWKIIQEQIQWFGSLMGINVEAIGGQRQYNSGFQLKLAKQGVIDRNNSKKAFYMQPTRDIIQLLMECASHYGNEHYPDNPNITIIFAEIQVESDPLQDRQVDTIDIANGVDDAFTIIKRRYPDMSDEDIKEHLDGIAERKKQAGGYEPEDIEEL